MIVDSIQSRTLVSTGQLIQTADEDTLVQHRIFSHENIISVANFPVLDCSQNDRMFNARTIV